MGRAQKFGGLVTLLSLALFGCASPSSTASNATPAPSAGAACANPNALGVSRTITLPRQFAQYGSAQHAAMPMLAPMEVVLTFDDGPTNNVTPKVLAALAEQCTKAVFFEVGQNIAAHPDLARQVGAAGHTMAIHSQTHPNFSQLSEAQQLAEITAPIAAFQSVFGYSPPAFRYPFLAETAYADSQLRARNLTVMSIDLAIDDWTAGSTEADLVNRLLTNLERTHGGIILMHDAFDVTGNGLPEMLRQLKAHGYKVVAVQWSAQ